MHVRPQESFYLFEQERERAAMVVEVKIMESGLVAPTEETPKHALWLSDVDLHKRQFTPTIYYYTPTSDPDFFSPAALKAALSKALVPFYPLAGRLVRGHGGRPEIDCNGDGSLFVVASSDSTLGDLGEVVPSEETKRLLVPSPETADPPCGLLMLQVTFFKCGGVCLGTALHHYAADGASGIHFMNAWSDITRGAALSVAPFLDRTVLQRYSILDDRVTVPTSAPPTETALLTLTKDQVEHLKNSAGSEAKRRLSTFKAVAAHVWRCACMARGLAADQETRLYMPVDVRSRLNPPLPAGYLGNAFSRVSAVSTAGEIVSRPIEFGAEKIREALEGSKPEAGEREMTPGVVWAVSWLAMPIYELDFGWGKPTFMVRASVDVAGMAYIMYGGLRGDDGVRVALALETENMRRFKKFFYEKLGGEARDLGYSV